MSDISRSCPCGDPTLLAFLHSNCSSLLASFLAHTCSRLTVAAGLGLSAGLGTGALPTSQRHATLNLKLFDTSPDLLPPNLRHHLNIMLQQNATFMEASMRAGEAATTHRVRHLWSVYMRLV